MIPFRSRPTGFEYRKFLIRTFHYSIVPLFLFSLFDISFSNLSDFITREFHEARNSIERIDSLLQQRYTRSDSVGEEVDFAVKSINFYKETDLNTGTSSYFTNVVVTRKSGMKDSVDVRLGLEDGTTVDTVWFAGSGDSLSNCVPEQTFEFETASPPEYAQVDPSNKIKNDNNYSNNSLTVESFILPVVKWTGRALNFFQNVLLSSGAFI